MEQKKSQQTHIYKPPKIQFFLADNSSFRQILVGFNYNFSATEMGELGSCDHLPVQSGKEIRQIVIQTAFLPADVKTCAVRARETYIPHTARTST